MKPTSKPAALLILLLLVVPWASHRALARGGTDVGNAGNVITLPDGRMVLADPYIQRPDDGHGNRFEDFNPAIKAEIELVGRLLVRLGAAVDQSVPPPPPQAQPLPDPHARERAAQMTEQGRLLSRSAQARFVVENVEDRLVEYHFVDQLPPACHAPDDMGTLPDGSVNQLGACTQGDVTWFRKDLFAGLPLRNGAPDDPREQVKWIIHERLYPIDVEDNPRFFIADITDGIDVLLDLYRAEASGQRPILTDAQLDKLQTLMERIASFRGLTTDGSRNERFLNEWQISRNGGGLAHVNAHLDPAAYLGVGSLLGEGGSMTAGSEMLDSSCFLVSCLLSPGASLQEATISPRASLRSNSPDDSEGELLQAAFGPNARLRLSSLFVDLPVSPSAAGAPATPAVSLSDGASIESSTVSGVTSLALGSQARLLGSAVDFNVQDDGSTGISLGAGASLGNLVALIQAPRGNASTVRSLSLPASANLDFQHAPVCAPPTLPQLAGALAVPTPDALKATCAAVTGPLPR